MQDGGPVEGQVPVSSPMQPSPGGMNQAYHQQEPTPSGPYLSSELNDYEHELHSNYPFSSRVRTTSHL